MAHTGPDPWLFGPTHIKFRCLVIFKGRYTGFHTVYPLNGYPSAAITPVLRLLQKYNQTNTKVNR
jgi:hypothetical protein